MYFVLVFDLTFYNREGCETVQRRGLVTVYLETPRPCYRGFTRTTTLNGPRNDVDL